MGQPDVCEPLTEELCDAVDRASPDAGGWSRYVLPMGQSIRWARQVIFENIRKHANERAAN